MATQVNKYDIRLTPGLTKGSYASSITFEKGIVLAVEMEIPGGHSGKTGIQLWYFDAQVLPKQPDIWFTGNKTKQRIELDDPFPGGTGWIVYAYNIGKRSHTFRLTVETDPLGIPSALFPRVYLLPSIAATEAYEFETAIGEGVLTPGTGTSVPVI